MKKNIGIFIAYAPGQSIKSHGISRLLSFMLHGMQQNDDTQVVIATPGWFEKDITEFMQEQHINIERVQLLTTGGVPYLLRIKQFLSSRKISNINSHASSQGNYFQKLISFGKKQLFNFFIRWMSIYSTPKFISVTILLCFLGTLLFPLLVATGVICSGLFVLHKFLKFIKKNTASIYIKPRNYLMNHRFTIMLFAQLSMLKNNVIARIIYNELRDRELTRLIRIINSRPDISAWFIPTLFWPEIKGIKAKKVIAAPDIVFVDFPTYYSDQASAQIYTRIAETISAGDHFICYSEHVKQKHLVQSFSVDPDKITVIPHGTIDLSVIFNKNISKRTGVTQRQHSIEILRHYQKTELQHIPYLSDFNLADMRFIFYSSQIRPYKNFFNLIRAYEILLRERFVNVKLVVTGDIQSDPKLYQYILDKRLQFDVLSFYDVSSEVLAALNHMAICAVNPTLFEGGFPFTFSEAYSVGTPSVMSAIPAVIPDIQDEKLREHMLFDPYNIDDMVNKIEWAVNNHAKLFELQAPLYQTFKQRDWSLVAKEYTNLLTDLSKPAYVEQ